mgnify:CR=1 FL=1|jgi:hypothetical protein
MSKYKIVYVNGGEEYCNSLKTPQEELYVIDEDNPGTWPLKKVNGKRYWVGDYFASFTPNDGRGMLDMRSRDYDLCPDVQVWLGVGEFEEDPSFYELYFWAQSAEMLGLVSAYYDLPYPITGEMSLELDTAPTNMAWKWNRGVPIVCASIKFRDDLPTMLKLYTYRKVKDE